MFGMETATYNPLKDRVDATLKTRVEQAFLSLVIVFISLFVFVPPLAALVVKDIRLGENGAMTRFVVETDGALTYSIFSLADPHRVVIDMTAGEFSGQYGSTSRGLVSGYRFGLFQPGTARLVLDLKGPAAIATHFIIPPRDGAGYRLVVDMQPTTRDAFLAGVKASADAAPETNTVASAPSSAQAQSQAQVQMEARAEAQGAPAVTPPSQKAPATTAAKTGNAGKRVIVIDPGHGGVDPGAISIKGAHEKNVTLNAARIIKAQLEKTGRYTVVLTRNGDVFLPLRDRFTIARKAGADLFMSLHADSFKTADVRGASVYTLSEKASDKEAEALAAKENKADIIAGIDLGGETAEVSSILIDLARRETMNYSAHFAGLLVKEMDGTVPLRTNTHRFAGFMVLKAPDVPSVLVEMGYLSNAQDAAALSNTKHLEKLGAAIARAVDGFFLKVASHQVDVL